MASHALRLLRFLGVVLLAGLCASGGCTVFITSEHDCDGCDDCLDCDDCDCFDCDCDDCGCDDPQPPPLVLEALVIEPDGSVQAGWVIAPAGVR